MRRTTGPTESKTMTMFIFKIILGIILIATAKYLIGWATKPRRDTNDAQLARFGSKIAYALAVIMFLYAVAGTSVVWVSSGKIAVFERTYLGTSLAPGRIVAIDGELGPQAKIMTAGFHVKPFITLINRVRYVDVYTVPNGQCAIMSAKDGKSIPGGSAFAEPWTEDNKSRLVNDAEYFLTEGKGQRGPQTTVLMPGSYTINPYLWEDPRLIGATRVEQGTVGVVKSALHAAVDFGSFKRSSPTNGTLRVLTKERLPRDSASALLVPVGAIGVWEEVLPNGLYYINTDAYKITMVPTVAQVYEYKGGYKKRTVDISVNDKGEITERVSEVEVQAVPSAADTAIFTKPEGWDVPQECRVLAQVSPELAPFVVASLGLTEANAAQIIEDRVVTPIIRSVIRDVEGGAQIPIRQMKAVMDKDGKPVLNEAGEPRTALMQEFRPVRVMDLLENRSSLEDAIEERARPEALKEGVTINEVRLSESAIPAELLIARKREQLAQQLAKAWLQEQVAQTQRQKTENARAQANQQSELVTAEIKAEAAIKTKQARTTEGEGEKAYLIAIAEGQKAQSEVLGQEITAKLQMFQQTLKMVDSLMQRNPEIIANALNNAHKFVPTITVSGNGGSSLEGAAAIFGSLTGGGHLLESPAAKPKEKEVARK